VALSKNFQIAMFLANWLLPYVADMV